MPNTVPYQDPQRPIKERVEDLLGRVTIEEKIGQMTQLDGRHEAERWLRGKHVGSFLHTLGPLTQELQRLTAGQLHSTGIGKPPTPVGGSVTACPGLAHQF